MKPKGKVIEQNIAHSKGHTLCMWRCNESRTQTYLQDRCMKTKSKCHRPNDSEKTCFLRLTYRL